MRVFDIFRETFAGLRLGARYAVSKPHSYTGKAIQTRITSLGDETFGR